MMELPRPMDNADRDFFAQHFRAIAKRMEEMRLYRNPWRIDLPCGIVFNFEVKYCLRRGSKRWKEEQEKTQCHTHLNP